MIGHFIQLSHLGMFGIIKKNQTISILVKAAIPSSDLFYLYIDYEMLHLGTAVRWQRNVKVIHLVETP